LKEESGFGRWRLLSRLDGMRGGLLGHFGVKFLVFLGAEAAKFAD
jgi:hypothetical protein